MLFLHILTRPGELLLDLVVRAVCLRPRAYLATLGSSLDMLKLGLHPGVLVEIYMKKGRGD